MTVQLPLSAYSDGLLRKHTRSLEAFILKHPKVGKEIVAKAPKRLVDRLPFLLSRAEELDRIETEKKKYKNGHLPVGVREFIESPRYMNKKGVVWPKVIDEIEEACSGKYVEGVFTGGIGCLPGESEYLTPTGWKRLDQWEYGDLVGQFDPATRRVSFCLADPVVEQADEWIEFSRPHFSMTVSPEHTVLLEGMTGAIRTATAEAMATGAVKAGSYTVPGAFSCGGDGVGLSNDELRLMVAVLADGNFHPRSKGNLCRVTVRRERKKDRLEALLTRMGRSWRTTGPYPKRPTEVCYWFEAPLKTKSWAWAWACSTEQLETLYSEIPFWDGLHPESTPTAEWRFHSVEKDAVDFVQYMCHAIGKRAAVRTDPRGGNRRPMYFVSAKTQESPNYRMNGIVVTRSKARAGELKYCFSTETGYFVVRQKGRVFVTGNCAKSTAALYIQAYLLYQLSCMKSPHAEFGLDPASEIMIIFQSLNASVAQEVEMSRFREMITASPYFKAHFQYDKSLKESMRFPNRIVVKSVSGSDTAAIGQNVIAGIIDEVNFLQVVEKSKQSRDGGVYDQAVELYNSIVRRRESRFMQAGKVWGLLCLVSSARYPGQFTDKRKEARNRQLAETGQTNIFFYDKRRWEVEDHNSKAYSYSGQTFRLFLGDVTRKPRILMDDEQVPEVDQHLVMAIPVEHKGAFQDDMYDAIRDVAGMATLATHPFIPYPEKIAACFGKVQPILSRPDCDFKDAKVAIYPNRFRDLTQPRFIHCDLSISGDSTGFACGYVSGFELVERVGGDKELLPRIKFDAVLEIKPPRGGEIDYANVRGLIYKLQELGLPIRWVSFDSFNSHDSIMLLRQKGFITGLTSVDSTPVPYEILKQAIIDERVEMPEHKLAQLELVTLERDPATGKIDHPESSSKDCSDCIASVVYGLTMRREVWTMHGINPSSIPRSVVQAVQNGKNSVAGGVGSGGQ